MTEEIQPSELLLTASRMNTKSSCDMKDYYSYKLGYKPVRTSSNLLIGTMCHRGLQAFWDQLSLKDALLCVEECSLNTQDPDDPNTKMNLLLSKLYVEGYYNQYLSWFLKSLDEGKINNIETEKEFKVKIMGYNFIGKMDAYYLDEYGMPVVREFKTVSKSSMDDNSVYVRKLPMAMQTTIYASAIQRLLSPDDPERIVPTIVYDLIGKTGKKPAQKRPYLKKTDYDTPETFELAKELNVESPSEFEKRIRPDYIWKGDNYKTKVVMITREELRRRMLEVILLEEQRPSDRPKELRTRSEESCSGFGGCQFFDVCLGLESINSPLFTMKERIHEELSIETTNPETKTEF